MGSPLGEANPFRTLPQVQRILDAPEARALAERFGRKAVADAVRSEIAGLRRVIAADCAMDGSADGPAAGAADKTSCDASAGSADACDVANILSNVADRLGRRALPGLRRAINATGVIIHTNLGRAPMAPEAINAAAAAAAGYCNLEYDLATGARGSRTAAVEPLIRDVTGAEAGIAVNNGAAAILLALAALANGGEVIVSRGELVEIGGGFRIPDVIRQGGARLVEVGSTNKTRVEDYAAAIGPDTRVLLKVHQSNFRTVGFTAEAGLAELADLARDRGLLLVADLGSGLLAPSPTSREPTVRNALAAGADIVTCSGDKLLGGPQAGIVAGRATVLDPLRRHPLLRAVRLDKMALAALEATLRLHRDHPVAVPVLRMTGQAQATVRARAERLRGLAGTGEVIATDGFTGGGALPEERIASAALALDPHGGADALAAALRAADPPVIGRIAEGRVLIDLLAVADDEVEQLAFVLRASTGVPG